MCLWLKLFAPFSGDLTEVLLTESIYCLYKGRLGLSQDRLIALRVCLHVRVALTSPGYLPALT